MTEYVMFVCRSPDRTLDMKPKLEWAPYPSSLEVEEIINEQYEFTLAPLLAPVYVIALQNYISLLRALRNEQLLYQAKEIKTALHELSGLLSDKDRAKIHLERNFDGLTILVYGGKDDFRQTVSEADIYIQVERQQKAAEAAKELKLRIAAEKKAEKMRLERLERCVCGVVLEVFVIVLYMLKCFVSMCYVGYTYTAGKKSRITSSPWIQRKPGRLNMQNSGRRMPSKGHALLGIDIHCTK